MIKVNKILGLRRATGESVINFREKVDVVMAQYGYSLDGRYEEQNGAVKVRTYSGVNNQFLVCKFPAREDGKSLLSLRKNSGAEEKWGIFIRMKEIPENIAQELVKDLRKYDLPKIEESYKVQYVLGILKVPEENRREFRTRLDGFLSFHDFKGGNFLSSDNGNFLYKTYLRDKRQKIEVICLGDNVPETEGFDFIAREEFYPYDSGIEDLADAALVFDEVSSKERKEIHRELEKKFIV